MGDSEVSEYSQYSGQTLAYIGDTVFELYNREESMRDGDKKAADLHRICTSRANAVTQGKMALALADFFTDEERAVYLRGRNADVKTKAKNATYTEYHEATGLEAVVGYLFLLERHDRIAEILDEGFRRIGIEWKRKK